ncbi:hypothetical protein [Butyrivibrio sp. AC2005]|uniref:hypothetical protein n=1 Tax=Butyrivibrio sp. AC2005 TaxID=1280672 RepID=UPI000417761B|nr:hypothetical protein [Butyrivibrio sp. AC2005]
MNGMKDIEYIFKNAKFSDDGHKSRLHEELFNDKIVSYKRNNNGGKYMSDDKNLSNTPLGNELTDDDLDNAAAGVFFASLGGGPSIANTSRIATKLGCAPLGSNQAKGSNAIFIQGQNNQANTLSGGPGPNPDGTTIC